MLGVSDAAPIDHLLYSICERNDFDLILLVKQSMFNSRRYYHGRRIRLAHWMLLLP